MYYRKFYLPKYKARKHWIKEVLDISKHMQTVSKIIESYAFYLDEHQGEYMLECVNDVIAYITEIAYMFGSIFNSKVVFENGTLIGAIINAFEDECRPHVDKVKRIMKGIK